MAGKFTIKKSTNGKFLFNLVAGNGQVILTSEMYETRAAAQNGIKSVKTNSKQDARFERRESKKGQPYFVLKAKNGLEIGRSQMYKSADGMENGIKSVAKNAPTASIVDSTAA